MMELPVSLIVVAGLASHLLYYIRGEHHMNAPKIFYSYTALAIGVFIYELQICDGALSALRDTAVIIGADAGPLFLSIVIYRICFHRLGSFPGPVLARVSKFWNVYEARHSLNHLLMQKLHDEYGSFVRTGKRDSRPAEQDDESLQRKAPLRSPPLFPRLCPLLMGQDPHVRRLSCTILSSHFEL